MSPTSSYVIGQDLYKKHVHHESFEQLWNTKWKQPCKMGVYPFMFGRFQDFQQVADQLIDANAGEPWDWDAYAQAFITPADRLVSKADEAERAGEKDKAREFYFRASALYRIGRFPIPRTPKQYLAWSRGKEAFVKANALSPHPLRVVSIPHTHGQAHEGKTVQALIEIPVSTTAQPIPVVILVCGLDGYRTELACNAEPMRLAGVALFICEIPGTGDSPADPADPTSVDRQISTILDWIDKQPELDSSRVALWGASTGGFYAARAAHTHPDRLRGCVCQGGGVHHMFDKDWLDEVDHLEYPFDLAESLAWKWGYGTDVEKFKEEAQAKFSLKVDGTMDKPCTRLLLINGTEDSIFPSDDIQVLLQTGPCPKEARTFPGKAHMGEPLASPVLYNWLFDLFGMSEQKARTQEFLKHMVMPIEYDVDV